MSLFERLDLDDPETTLKHKEIIQQNSYLRRLYEDFYGQFQRCALQLQKEFAGARLDFVEIGSGGGFLKEVMPQIITSDVVPGAGIDRVFSAMQMPFADGTVHAFFMLNVFHHIHDSATFLQEMSRCLAPGGRVLMIEPANTLLGRFIYQNFHHEPFDPHGGWSFPAGGRLTQANGALPWIVFERDRQPFKQRFPQLELHYARPHTPLRYLASGGLSFKQPLPTFLYPVVAGIERLLTPGNRWLGLFMSVELSKRRDN